MPIKIEKRCRVCQVIDKGDVQLLRRIYKSAKYRADGEPLKQIWEDYQDQFNYIALTQHAKRHQAIRSTDLKKAALEEIHKRGANEVVMGLIKHQQVRDLVMQKGYKGIKSGKIKLKASDVVKAAKDAADIELKQKDQGLQLMEMMMRFQSGEMAPTGDTNGEPPYGSGSGSDTRTIIDTP